MDDARSDALSVLRVITRLNVGGPTRHVALLQEGLSAHGIQSHLAAGAADPTEGAGLLAVPGAVHALPGLARAPSIRGDFAAWRALGALVRGQDPDIIHTHQAKAGALVRLGLWKRGRAFVHTFHGHTFAGYWHAPVQATVLALERLAARRSDALICQSPSQAEEIAEALGQSADGRIAVIPPALPRAFLDPASLQRWRGERLAIRQAQRVEEGESVLVLPARLVPIKRPHLALELLRGLTERRKCSLWFLGDGPLRAEVQSMAHAQGLAGQVRWLGAREPIGPYLAAADLAVLTSRNEGTPLALLEAAALGIPVLGPELGGVRDVLGADAALVAVDAAAEAWVERAAEVLDRGPAAADVVARADRVRVAQDPERLCAAVASLYRRLRGG